MSRGSGSPLIHSKLNSAEDESRIPVTGTVAPGPSGIRSPGSSFSAATVSSVSSSERRPTDWSQSRPGSKAARFFSTPAAVPAASEHEKGKNRDEIGIQKRLRSHHPARQ